MQTVRLLRIPCHLSLLVGLLLLVALPATAQYRIMISTDFPPVGVVKSGERVPNTLKSDPDDMQSMVRFLLYANEFDVEGLIASAGTFAMTADKHNILGVLDEYERVYANLQLYDPAYPTPAHLRAVTYEGKGTNHDLDIKWGCGKQPYTDIVGEGLDSEASNAIIAAADRPDPRPLWIAVWGGPREVAQAIWDVRQTRSEAEAAVFVAKLRVFLIHCQDASQEWLMEAFPDLFVIESIKTYGGMFSEQDSTSDLAWVNRNVRFDHGALGSVYPHEGIGSTGVCEGDSPSFLHLVSAARGINNPEDPTQPGWGGQYTRVAGTNHYVDGPGPASIRKWREDFQADFRQRMDWCVRPQGTQASGPSPKVTKPRIINTTDLGADPDDKQSMVRQLVSADAYDIEGLIVATGCWKPKQENTAMLDTLVDAYAAAYPNLSVHAPGFPTPEYLRSVSVMGQTGYGMGDVGNGKSSPGSDLIIATVDRDDPRPVWVMGWGGMNTVAQAIWEVRETRSAEELSEFLSKLRLFDILGQDDAGAWIAHTFPEVFYIRATEVYGWQPTDAYLDEHVQNHGALGAVYPDRIWATEGDTPSFLHVYTNGLNDPERIGQGGWGGRFDTTERAGIRSMSEVAKIDANAETQYDPYYMSGNVPVGEATFTRWKRAIHDDFAARMDWSITDTYDGANHHPIAVLNGSHSRDILTMEAYPGTDISLSAEGSADPDGNTLQYAWYYYSEPSSYDGPVTVVGDKASSCIVRIPEAAAGQSLHLLLEVRDDGVPNLVVYRRMIINVRTDK